MKIVLTKKVYKVNAKVAMVRTKQNSIMIIETHAMKPEKFVIERYATDVIYRLSKNLKNRLRESLLSQLTSKNDRTEDLLGMSYSDIKNYIEFLMTPNMRWGIIELDHVRPLNSFDLKNIEQLKEASHYSNL